MSCPACGYAPQDTVIAFLQEELPPPVLERLAQHLQELAAAKGSAHIELHLHVRDGHMQEVEPKWDERYRLARSRDASVPAKPLVRR